MSITSMCVMSLTYMTALPVVTGALTPTSVAGKLRYLNTRSTVHTRLIETHVRTFSFKKQVSHYYYILTLSHAVQEICNHLLMHLDSLSSSDICTRICSQNHRNTLYFVFCIRVLSGPYHSHTRFVNLEKKFTCLEYIFY